MKKNILYLLSLILLMVSCAEEGPYTLGTLKCDIQVVQCNSTTALLDVTFPSAGNNLFMSNYEDGVFVLDHSLIQGQDLYDQGAIKGQKGNGHYWFFSNLKPNTTYYVVLKHGVNLNHEDYYDWDSWCYYETNYSFKTAAEESFEIGTKWIVPNAALLTITFPSSEMDYLDQRGVRFFLSDKPFGPQSNYSYESVMQNNKDYILSVKHDRYSHNEMLYDKYELIVNGLTPNTTYYVGVLIDEVYKKEFGGTTVWHAYVTDYSITTTAPGDYSKLGISFEFLGNIGNNTYAKLCFPPYFKYEGNESLISFVSLNSDFSFSVKGKCEREGYIKQYYGLQDNEVAFNYPLLELGKYFVKFEGTLIMNFKDAIYDYYDYHNRIYIEDLKIEGPVEYGD